MPYVLAQYTIRSKQEYIFRSNRITEIIGASDNITKSWDILFDQADKVFGQSGTAGKKTQRIADQTEFHMSETEKAFKEQALHMVELFRGGGNDTVLFDSRDNFEKVNKAFSRYLLEHYPGMIPMAVCCSCTGDYQHDYACLMQEADREKNCMISGQNDFILPFSMMDRNTFQPYSRVIYYKDSPVRLTDEAYSKRIPGQEISRKDQDVKLLDNMVTEKGQESLLAVVHADGNNMGIKIAEMLKGKTDYDTCISEMRKFTADTAKAFGEQGLEAMEACRARLKEKYADKYNDTAFLFRKIITDGDDMTFVCNARFAREFVQAYLDSVQSYQIRNQSEWIYSSCAGICIFHSHYPFSRAYAMAEQACDNAKEKVHGKRESSVEEGWMDFHYIHNGIGGELSSIRERQGTDTCMARPWLIAGGDSKDSRKYDRLTELHDLFSRYGVSRSDIKTIGSEYENSLHCGRQELIRIYGHHKGLQEETEAVYPEEEQLLKVLYDMSEVYDLWFKEG